MAETWAEILRSDTTAKRSIVLTAAGGWPTTTSGCAGPTLSETSTNKVNVYTLDFADGASVLYAQWQFIMPDSYDGSTITAKFIWMANSTSTNSVVWGIQGVALSDNEALDTAFGTAVEVTDANGSTANLVRISAESSAITLGNTPVAGDFIVIQVYRDPTDGADTLAATANLLAVRLEWGILTYSD